ncbi:MAG TPA: 50S ribosomal protein L15 [bacterium]|nr:50S ribosomal protein L15 [bacterium]
MELEKIKTQNKKRLGRGLSAGGGKTAGRGTKGQKARAGHNIPRKFEGGQTALSMRLPIMPGFKSHKPKAEVVSLDLISLVFKDGETVSAATLEEKGIIKAGARFKVLNNGTLSVKVTLDSSAHASEATRKIFESGTVEAKSKTEEKTETVAKAKESTVKEETVAPKAEKVVAKKPAAKKAAS